MTLALLPAVLCRELGNVIPSVSDWTEGLKRLVPSTDLLCLLFMAQTEYLN